LFASTSTKDRKIVHLRLLMWLFLVAMAIPTIILVSKSYDQLKWEAFYQHRQLAEELANRIDQSLNKLLLQEENRSFGDYGFLMVESNVNANFLRRSPLSNYPVTPTIPGLFGYFQIDPQGRFTTPLIPVPVELASQYGISSKEVQNRLDAQRKVQNILTSNDLLTERFELPTPSLSYESRSRVADKKEVESSLESVSPPIVTEHRSQQNEASAPYQSDLIFDDNNLAQKTRKTTVTPELAASQSAFDEISQQNALPTKARKSGSSNERSLGRIDDLELDPRYAAQIAKREDEKKAKVKQDSMKGNQGSVADAVTKKTGERKISREAGVIEEAAVIAPETAVPADKSISSRPSIKIFANEIDPIELTLLDSGHLVFFRKVWREGKRYIQGILVEQDQFLSSIFQQEFSQSLIADMSNMAVVYHGNVLSAYGNTGRGRDYRLAKASSLNGSLLYRARMSAPFENLESVYTINKLPAGPGASIVWWAAWVLALVLTLGTYLLYRLSLRNLKLAGQQQDFVSAVSHELKTPLTSIRMYGEILKSGWADEKKKEGYYSFIFDESERLTRLINNVLALARMTRNETQVSLQAISVAELIDIIHSKVDSQIESAGFNLKLAVQEEVKPLMLKLDPDLFTQIVINIVDNALKFSAHSENKNLDVSVERHAVTQVRFAIRDYGPGIAKDQMKKIFGLFYRSENELTRETTGTGIGLALVSQLTQLMSGKVDVVNCAPGAEFRLYFPCLK